MSLVDPLTTGLVPWRGLTRAAYEAMVDAGLLDGAPVELLEGVLVEVSPQGEQHSRPIMLLTRWLARNLPDQYFVRPQLPLAATEHSEPEPDLAVVTDTPGRHPGTAILTIEVTVTTQRLDLEVKPLIYAAAGVREYWVIDVPRREVVVHTGPTDSAGYTSRVRRSWDEALLVPVDPGEVVLALVLADVLA